MTLNPADSSITAVGTTFSDEEEFLVTRLDAAGRQDSSFNNGSPFIEGFSAELETARAVGGGLQADGTFVAIGTRVDLIPNSVGLMRLTAKGTLDSTFGTGGKREISFPTDTVVNSGLVLADNRIVAVGDNGAGFLMCDNQGSITISSAANTPTLSAVAVDDQQRFVAIGGANSFGPSSSPLRLARFDSNCNTDTTFGESGVAIAPESDGAAGTAIAIRPDGKLLVTSIAVADSETAELRQFLSDGSPDPSFGTNGIVTLSTTRGDRPIQLALQSDGRAIVLVANVNPYLIRIRTDGAPDATFGGATGPGRVLIPPDRFSLVEGLLLSEPHKILVSGGLSVKSQSPRAVVIRLWI